MKMQLAKSAKAMFGYLDCAFASIKESNPPTAGIIVGLPGVGVLKCGTVSATASTANDSAARAFWCTATVKGTLYC